MYRLTIGFGPRLVLQSRFFFSAQLTSQTWSRYLGDWRCAKPTTGAQAEARRPLPVAGSRTGSPVFGRARRRTRLSTIAGFHWWSAPAEWAPAEGRADCDLCRSPRLSGNDLIRAALAPAR